MDGEPNESDLLGYERMFAKEIPCWVRAWFLMGQWYLGQTINTYEVSPQWLRTFRRLLWINCNSLEGEERLLDIDADFRLIHWNENSLMHSVSAYDVNRTNKGDIVVGCKVEEPTEDCIVFRPEYGTIKDLGSVRGIITSQVRLGLTLRM